MAKNNDIHEELLKQMDQNSGSTERSNKKSIEKILARDAARVKRMKWVTACTWLLLVALYILGFIIGIEPSYQKTILVNVVLLIPALFLIAVFFTVSLYIRWRSLNTRQIQQRLSEIEKLLRKLDRD